MEMKTINFENLAGEHFLSGVDTEFTSGPSKIRFILDGITYEVEEDEDDGYRSFCGGMYITEKPVKNVFTPVKVKVEFNGDGLVFIDAGKPVLEIGTDYSDNYYPTAILNWYPENLSWNRRT